MRAFKWFWLLLLSQLCELCVREDSRRLSEVNAPGERCDRFDRTGGLTCTDRNMRA